MPKISEDTMRELDDILNENDPGAGRLNEFLKLKTSAKPQCGPQFVLGGGGDISFDVDVDLIKLPAKQLQKQTEPLKVTQKVFQKQIPRLSDNTFSSANAQQQQLVAASQPQPDVFSENIPPSLRSHSLSPAHMISSPEKAPNSNRLHRAAISGRNLLLNSKNVGDEISPSESFSFVPGISSTPALDKPQRLQRELTDSQKPQRRDPALTCVPLIEAAPLNSSHKELEKIFHSSVLQIQRRFTNQVPSPNANLSKGATFTIPKKSTQSSQLAQSTSNNSSTRQSLPKPPRRTQECSVLVRRLSQNDLSQAAAAKKVELPKTPKRCVPESELTPEQMMKTLHSSNQGAEMQIETPTTSSTSGAAAAVSCGVQTSCIGVPCQAVIQTSDSSVDENAVFERTAPLNLAPTGGNITRLRRLLKEQHAKETSSQQLLDLHCTRISNSLENNPNAQKQTHAVLNKPPRPAINGEQFAKELQRMSNYEILDLRKRISSGKLNPLTDQNKPNIMQQQEVEQSIQVELLRRNLAGVDDDLPSTATTIDHETLPSVVAMPPNGFRNSLEQKRSSIERAEPVKRRNKRRDPPMTAELLNYITVSQTIAERLKSSSRLNTKRSLYTKGFSDVEDNVSPAKQTRLSYIQIAPAPPTDSGCIMPIEDIEIVPPPPASIRYSQCMRRSQKFLHETHLPNSAANSGQVEESEKVQQEQQEQQTSKAAGQNNVGVENVQMENVEMENVEVEETENVQIKTENEDKEEIEKTKAIEDIIIKEERTLENILNEIEIDEQVMEDHVVNEFRTEKEAQQPVIVNNEGISPSQSQSNNVEESSTTMEELRMDTPTPPLVMDQTNLDDQPSTSSAARKSLQRSLKKAQQKAKKAEKPQKTKQAKPSNDDDDGVFKKPLAPAPRRKNQVKKALDQLRITLVNETLPEDVDTSNDHDTTGVRRSRRGHVPLRNTWVHSVSDPFKFTFFERSLSTYTNMKVKKLKLSTSTKKNKSVSNEPPLFSSTPRNQIDSMSSSTLKRKRNEQPEPLELTGITQLTDITEEESEEQPMAVQAPQNTQHSRIKASTKNASRTKKTKTDILPKQTTERDTDSDSEPDTAKSKPMPRLKLGQPTKKIRNNNTQSKSKSEAETEPQSEQIPSPKRGRPKNAARRNARLDSDSEEDPEPEQMPLPVEVVAKAITSPKHGRPKNAARRNTRLDSDSEEDPEPEQMPLPVEVVAKAITSPKRGRPKSAARRNTRLDSDSEEDPEPEQMPLPVEVVAKAITSPKRGRPKNAARRNTRLDSDSEEDPEPQQMPLPAEVVAKPITSPKRGRPKNAARRNARLDSDSEEDSEPEQMPLPVEVVAKSITSPKRKQSKKTAKRNEKSNSDSEEEPEPEPMAMLYEAEAESRTSPNLERLKNTDRANAKSNSEPEPEPEPQPMALQEEVECEPEQIEPEQQPAIVEAAPILTDGERNLLQLTSWLRGSSTESLPTHDDNEESENDAIKFTSAADLEFRLIDGIEYAFFKTEEKYTMGYIRFPPLSERGMKRNKTNTLRFLVIYGEFDVVLDLGSNKTQTRVLRTGDMVEIKRGIRFNIINRFNEVCLIMVNRVCKLVT